MNNLTAYLIRTEHQTHTSGIFTLTDGKRVLFTCNTIELPNKGNQQNISCIPTGTYSVIPYSSEKFPNVYQVQNVPNRDKILIHIANTVGDLLGCIGVGLYEKDGLISTSRITLGKLKKIAPKFTLVIMNAVQRGERDILPIPEIISLFSTLLPSVVQLLANMKGNSRKKVEAIQAVYDGDNTLEEKNLLIGQILKMK